jgi:hypothetical protein
MKNQTDKELADAGRMLAAELSKIAAELTRRGLDANVQGYYLPGAEGMYWHFEVMRVTTETI